MSRLPLLSLLLCLFSLSAIASGDCGSAANTQLEMNQCAHQDFKAADAELNIVYQEIRALYADDQKFLDALRNSQRAWIKLRDADMALYYPHTGERGYYGSIQPLCNANTMTRFTQQRTEFLKQWLQGTEEGDVCSGSIATHYHLEQLRAKSVASITQQPSNEPVAFLPLSMWEGLQASKNKATQHLLRIATQWPSLAASADLSRGAIHSWLPDRGIRGRYQIAKQALGKQALEALLNEQAFLRGPHDNGINYTSTTEFGHYNPKFLIKLGSLLQDIFANAVFVSQAQTLYDAEFKQYLRTYYLAYTAATQNPNIATSYQQVIEKAQAVSGRLPFQSQPSYHLQEAFRAFSNDLVNRGYDDYEAFTAPGFWVRRSIDGTADEFYALLTLTLNTFDKAFIADAENSKSTTKPSRP